MTDYKMSSKKYLANVKVSKDDLKEGTIDILESGRRGVEAYLRRLQDLQFGISNESYDPGAYYQWLLRNPRFQDIDPDDCGRSTGEGRGLHPETLYGSSWPAFGQNMACSRDVDERLVPDQCGQMSASRKRYWKRELYAAIRPDQVVFPDPI